MNTPRILIVDRQDAVRHNVRRALSRDGFAVAAVGHPADALQQLEREDVDLAIIGLVAESIESTYDLIRVIQSRRAPPAVFVFATDSSEQSAIAALRLGVKDYFKQPALDELVHAVNAWMDRRAPSATGLPLIGSSAAMRRTREYIGRLAESDCSILITGETGTGKELVAALIHRNSARRLRPFVAINCAAIPDTLLESELFGHERGAFTGAHATRDGKLRQADGGTLFLDEIGDMSPAAQAKILRAVESREVQRLGGNGSIPVDVRTIAATNQDLEKLASENRFRPDLYFRLNVSHVELTPLRDRQEDIPLLLDYFRLEMNHRLGYDVEGFAPQAMARLTSYPWPGNVRELRNVVESVFVLRRTGVVAVEELPARLHRISPALEYVTDERSRLLSALEETKWNKSRAALKLHWSRMTLYRKMAQHHIEGGGARPRKAAAGC